MNNFESGKIINIEVEEGKKPEYQKSLRIKNFFKELKRVSYGDALVSVFKKFTDNKTWELGEKKIIGEIENQKISAMMVLRKHTGNYTQTILEVFRSKSDVNRATG